MLAVGSVHIFKDDVRSLLPYVEVVTRAEYKTSGLLDRAAWRINIVGLLVIIYCTATTVGPYAGVTVREPIGGRKLLTTDTTASSHHASRATIPHLPRATLAPISRPRIVETKLWGSL